MADLSEARIKEALEQAAIWPLDGSKRHLIVLHANARGPQVREQLPKALAKIGVQAAVVVAAWYGDEKPLQVFEVSTPRGRKD